MASPSIAAWQNRLVASPACNPQWSAPEAFAAYQNLGFQKFEVFTSWVHSRFEVGSDPAAYRGLAGQHGLRLTSFHLPVLDPDQPTDWETFAVAADAARALGASIVLYKAKTREAYVRGAPRALDLLESRGLTPVLQNHRGSALDSLENTLTTLEQINDPRMKVLLEVGHLHAAGCPWQAAWPALGSRTVLVHIKDIADGRSVPYGTGEVDLRGLFSTLSDHGYEGDIVVEIEIREEPETDRHLREALDFLRTHCFSPA
ncbi:MAG: sugar phosphate isomerase/epimerase [Puniceicoccaceae bacterium]|nr:MAG: sugar phosphate isomerase/epimerase [Puniceicoccaceae bacterium]